MYGRSFKAPQISFGVLSLDIPDEERRLWGEIIYITSHLQSNLNFFSPLVESYTN